MIFYDSTNGVNVTNQNTLFTVTGKQGNGNYQVSLVDIQGIDNTGMSAISLSIPNNPNISAFGLRAYDATGNNVLWQWIWNGSSLNVMGSNVSNVNANDTITTVINNGNVSLAVNSINKLTAANGPQVPYFLVIFIADFHPIDNTQSFSFTYSVSYAKSSVHYQPYVDSGGVYVTIAFNGIAPATGQIIKLREKWTSTQKQVGNTQMLVQGVGSAPAATDLAAFYTALTNVSLGQLANVNEEFLSVLSGMPTPTQPTNLDLNNLVFLKFNGTTPANTGKIRSFLRPIYIPDTTILDALGDVISTGTDMQAIINFIQTYHPYQTSYNNGQPVYSVGSTYVGAYKLDKNGVVVPISQ